MTATLKAPKNWRSLDLAAKMRLRWRLQARPNQLTPDVHALCDQDESKCAEVMAEADKIKEPSEREQYMRDHGHYPWFIWLMTAGRGFGKTRSGAEDIVKYAIEHPGSRIALVAPTSADGRDTIVEGNSGVLSVLPSSLLLNWNRSIGELILTNGSRMKVFSAETPDRLRGPQHHRAYCDELASWEYLQETWDMLLFGLRLGQNPQVVITTTPRPLPFLRSLVTRSKEPAGGVVATGGSTFENSKNLAAAALAELRATYEGTRTGRQELSGEILEDVEGALWTLGIIEDGRLPTWSMPDWRDVIGRVVIAVDPAVTSNEKSDETGIVVAGMTNGICPFCARADRAHCVILEDCSGKYSPREWGLVVESAYRRWSADRIVAEVNQGGDLVVTNMTATSPHLPVKTIHATRGKLLRAEPVFSLYEKGVMHHFGGSDLVELERQMTSWDPTIKHADSPDRLDALVYAVTELLLPKMGAGATSLRDTRLKGRR